MTETNTTAKAKKAFNAKTEDKAAKAAQKAAKTVLTHIEQAQEVITELSRTNFDETVETTKAVLTSGDFRAAIELQNEFLRASFKRNLDAAREINEITVTAVREAVEPFTSKFADAFEKLRAA